jgi:hypothetical protein
MTHTEHVHLLFGIGLTMAGTQWLGAQAYPAGPLRDVWPLFLVAVGLFLVIPRRDPGAHVCTGRRLGHLPQCVSQ